MGNTVKALAGALVADGLALAVAFGVNISTVQQAAILAFVGSVTSVGVALVAWIETHHIKSSTALKVAAVSAIPAPAAKK